MKTWKTTEDDFNQFCQFVLDWVEIFGLRDWGITFAHLDVSGNHAQTKYKTVGRVATVTLAKLWDVLPTASSLNEVAKHEMLHLCLADLYIAATDRYTTERLLEDLEEGLVRRLQNAICCSCRRGANG